MTQMLQHLLFLFKYKNNGCIEMFRWDICHFVEPASGLWYTAYTKPQRMCAKSIAQASTWAEHSVRIPYSHNMHTWKRYKKWAAT